MSINHPPAEITKATVEIPGDEVLLANQNTIIFSVCNLYFEARRLGSGNGTPFRAPDTLICDIASEAPCVPAKRELGITIPAAARNFGARYPWYVQMIRKTISDNWQRPELDPTLTVQRVYVTFNIARDGHPSNVQVVRSSGVPLMDISAVRTLQRINTFGPLPRDYTDDRISVEFWFDYKK